MFRGPSNPKLNEATKPVVLGLSSMLPSGQTYCSIRTLPSEIVLNLRCANIKGVDIHKERRWKRHFRENKPLPAELDCVREIGW